MSNVNKIIIIIIFFTFNSKILISQEPGDLRWKVQTINSGEIAISPDGDIYIYAIPIQKYSSEGELLGTFNLDTVDTSLIIGDNRVGYGELDFKSSKGIF